MGYNINLAFVTMRSFLYLGGGGGGGGTITRELLFFWILYSLDPLYYSMAKFKLKNLFKNKIKIIMKKRFLKKII